MIDIHVNDSFFFFLLPIEITGENSGAVLNPKVCSYRLGFAPAHHALKLLTLETRGPKVGV